jgi:hypothetical protein
LPAVLRDIERERVAQFDSTQTNFSHTRTQASSADN